MKLKLTPAQISATVWIGLTTLGLGIAYAVYKSFTNFNKGTPYEGAGALGTLGNATNQILGGAPAAVGSAIGIGLFDLLHSDYEPGRNYIVTFPDGVRHQVASDDVNESTGRFYRLNAEYILKKDASGNRVAVKV